VPPSWYLQECFSPWTSNQLYSWLNMVNRLLRHKKIRYSAIMCKI
jgi:hypothetical protein